MRISDWSSDVCSSDLRRSLTASYILCAKRSRYPPTPRRIGDVPHRTSGQISISISFSISTPEAMAVSTHRTCSTYHVSIVRIRAKRNKTLLRERSRKLVHQPPNEKTDNVFRTD